MAQALKHIAALYTLALIYRSPRGVVRGYRDWLSGHGQLWGLRGEIRRFA